MSDSGLLPHLPRQTPRYDSSPLKNLLEQPRTFVKSRGSKQIVTRPPLGSDGLLKESVVGLSGGWRAIK
jgi:hypothetical protein